jgi:hypothetical protein
MCLLARNTTAQPRGRPETTNPHGPARIAHIRSEGLTGPATDHEPGESWDVLPFVTNISKARIIITIDDIGPEIGAGAEIRLDFFRKL